MKTPRQVPQVFREQILDAIANLQTLTGKTVLALVGIMIGTGAVVGMLHIGSNARAEAMHQFESLGIDLVSITPQGGQGGFGEDFVERLSTSDVGLTTISPIIQAGTNIRVGNANLMASLVATREGIFKLAKANAAEGRLISDLDNSSTYVVLGSDIAAKLWNAIGRTPEIGSQLAVDGQVLTIVGILAPSVPNLVLNLDLNQAIVIPLAAARRLIPEPLVSSIAGQLKPTTTELAMTSAVLKMVRGGRLPADTIHIQTARQLIAGLDQQMRVYGLLLLGIGAVSLIVGGVGVMNVMLMGVMERKREIGVRLAIGARQRDIATMFITEALVLSVSGAVGGVAIGTLAGWTFARMSGWQFEPALAAVPLGVGMSLIVGLFFGLYPAIRAARLDPIQALRAE
jgi:putative ABC transport system permease protein